MKKFHFSLQKLMDFRQQELDKQKNTLGALQAELRKIHEDAEHIRAELEEQSAELVRICSRGAQAYDIANRKRYIVTLQQEIHAKELQEIDKQLNVVVEATKDVKTLEKLEEKQLEEYRSKEIKENEQFIEEFVSGQTVRSSAV